MTSKRKDLSSRLWVYVTTWHRGNFFHQIRSNQHVHDCPEFQNERICLINGQKRESEIKSGNWSDTENLPLYMFLSLIVEQQLFQGRQPLCHPTDNIVLHSVQQSYYRRRFRCAEPILFGWRLPHTEMRLHARQLYLYYGDWRWGVQADLRAILWPLTYRHLTTSYIEV